MYDEYLIHFNPNHDPKTGKFSKSKIGSTAVRATAIGAAVGAGFAAERLATAKLKYPDATAKGIAKSAAYAFGRDSVAAALAVIGDQLYRDVKSKKAVKNQNGKNN